MVQPSKFKWLEFEWDEHNLSELNAHAVQFWRPKSASIVLTEFFGISARQGGRTKPSSSKDDRMPGARCF
jgi:hypothetical protein